MCHCLLLLRQNEARSRVLLGAGARVGRAALPSRWLQCRCSPATHAPAVSLLPDARRPHFPEAQTTLTTVGRSLEGRQDPHLLTSIYFKVWRMPDAHTENKSQARSLLASLCIPHPISGPELSAPGGSWVMGWAPSLGAGVGGYTPSASVSLTGSTSTAWG